MSNETQSLTVEQLRRRWTPHKNRLRSHRSDHPTHIRVHRALSWLGYTEKAGKPIDYDLVLVTQWIAFNALYGQWNEAAGEPLHDKECWRVFLERILELDSDDHIPDVLQANKRLVMSIFEDKHLSSFFWQEPTKKRAGQSKKIKYDAQSWYVGCNWALILDHVVDRIYLMRCQLVHGAATYRGKLNRTALRHCSTMLSHLLRTMLVVLIDHGADEDWGIMCYPPIQT